MLDERNRLQKNSSARSRTTASRLRMESRIAIITGATDGGAVLRLADADGKVNASESALACTGVLPAGRPYLGTYTRTGREHQCKRAAAAFYCSQRSIRPDTLREERTELTFRLAKRGSQRSGLPNRSRCSVEGRVRFDEKAETPPSRFSCIATDSCKAEQRADKETHWSIVFPIPAHRFRGKPEPYESAQSPHAGMHGAEGRRFLIKRRRNNSSKILMTAGYRSRAR